MRVVFVTSRFPWPLRRGDQLRAYHQLRELGARHAIRLVSLVDDPPGGEALRVIGSLCENVRLVRRSRVRSIAALPSAWLGGRPLQCGLFDSDALGRALEEELTRDVDLVHVQLARLDALARLVAPRPLFLDFVDALSLSTERRARRACFPLRLVLLQEARRLRRVERELLRCAAGAAVVSAADARSLGAPGHLRVVPLGVDFESFPLGAHPRDGRTVVFSGNLGYFANLDAAVFLLREIWPVVIAQVPSARLQLVGARPGRRLARMVAGSSGVTLVGPVADMGEALRAASVAVAPLRAGAGQQIKVLEAMASGTPVVATGIVAEGLGETGLGVEVADTPAEFADRIVALLEDGAMAASRGEAAAVQVRQQHSWSGSARALEAAWHAAIAGHSLGRGEAPDVVSWPPSGK